MFTQLWNKTNFMFRGLPRPYAEVPNHARQRVEAKGMKIASKVPIPWQSSSRFHEGSFLDVIKKHEEEVVQKGICAYCGLGFKPDDNAVIWIKYPKKMTRDRVWSDHFPFHLHCMDEVRAFCPHMKLTKDEEFKLGKYQELLGISIQVFEGSSQV